MNKPIGVLAIVILIALSSFFVVKASTDTYMKERGFSCKVLSKLDSQSEGRYYHHSFILVLSSEGKNFSLDVEPTTWAICKVGDTLLFTIAPYQLDYYNCSPLRWGFWAIIVLVFSSILILWIGYELQKPESGHKI